MSFQDAVDADGKIKVWDIPAKQWRKMFAVDAREAIANGTASFEEGAPDDPIAALHAMDNPQLVHKANEYRVANPQNMGRLELIRAISNSAGYTAAAKRAEHKPDPAKPPATVRMTKEGSARDVPAKEVDSYKQAGWVVPPA